MSIMSTLCILTVSPNDTLWEPLHFLQAVCCPDGKRCCPHNYICDVAKDACIEKEHMVPQDLLPPIPPPTNDVTDDRTEGNNNTWSLTETIRGCMVTLTDNNNTFWYYVV